MNSSLHIFPSICLLFLFAFHLSLIFKFTQKSERKMTASELFLRSWRKDTGASSQQLTEAMASDPPAVSTVPCVFRTHRHKEAKRQHAALADICSKIMSNEK